MKKLLLALFVVLCVASVAFGASQLVGTKHDLSSTGTNTYKGSVDQICIYCHTPHQAQTVAGAPLWNKQLGAGTTGAYSSLTMNNTTAAGAEAMAGIVTPLCMSCHDGSLAPAEHYVGSTLVDSGTNVMTGRLFTGVTTVDLAVQHPVDFQYTAGADTGISIPTTYPLFGAATNVFSCATCHDVHNGTNGFLRGTTSLLQSAFCVDCHTNK